MILETCFHPMQAHSSGVDEDSRMHSSAVRVDVWRVALDVASRARSVLSPDELARADRFHFERDKLRFIRCRSALRALLSDHLAIPADAIRFEYSANGKPRIAVAQNSSCLTFNVSHSADVALIAIGNTQHLGVDIERIRFDLDVSALAERFFSLQERAELRALPNDLSVSGFFAGWTRKEAFIKATGNGLSFPLANFSVSVHPAIKPQLKEIQGDADVARRWCLVDIKAATGYRAALAVESEYSAVEVTEKAYIDR